MKKISIVVPCFNEEEAIPFFYDEIVKVSAKMGEKYSLDFEYIFVDDGSKDKTKTVLREYSQKDERVKYISFSRNFGKEAGLYAGLERTSGDYVAVMDVDLQDPPELLEKMYLGIVEEGHDCVATKRSTRKGEPPIRSFFAHMFYKLINKISNANIVDGARDYRLMTRKMVDAILEVKEYNRFSKGIFGWIGFDIKWIEYENIERVAGQTKWSFWKLFLYSLDGIIAFSTAPLAISSIFGFIFCIAAFIMMLVFLVKTLIFGDAVQGFPTLVCIILFVSGVQMFCLGILGQYLSKNYLETKRRPIYIVKETEEDRRN